MLLATPVALSKPRYYTWILVSNCFPLKRKRRLLEEMADSKNGTAKKQDEPGIGLEYLVLEKEYTKKSHISQFEWTLIG